MTLCRRICSVFKRVGHQKNRVRTHPLREETYSSSKDCPWQKEKADALEEELNENESQVCFCNLRNLREENGPPQVQESTNNLCTLAETKLAGVLQAICKYRHSIHKISPKHRLRINQILQAVIRSASHIDHKLAKVIIKLAAEDMLRTTDLQDLYQDAAGDILVALWNHFPAEVLTKLLEGFQGRLIPYRSILCVLGKLANKAFTESDAVKIDVWERKLVEFAERLLIDVTDKVCFEELNQALRKVDQKSSTQSPERIFLYQYCGAILRASDDPQLIQVQLFTLLAMCQRGASEAKGISAACGLAASRHIDEVFKALDSFGRNLSTTETFVSKTGQLCQRNTLLLCYGRVALGIKEEVLPRVELIITRLIDCFLIDPSDLNLKKSFLIAVLMLLEAIAATGKAGVIRLHPKARLVECLIVLIEREPIHLLGSTVRQDAMYIAKELSHLKPLLEPEKKSSLLHASFKSVFCLAPMEILEGQSCIDEKTLDTKAHTLPCLPARDGSPSCGGLSLTGALVPQAFYQQTIGCFEEMLQALLLENPQPSELKHMMELSQEFSKLAHLMALLIGLCNDQVPCISSFAVQGVSCLYEILLHRKGLSTSKQKKRKWTMKRSVKFQEEDSPAGRAPGGSWQIAMHCGDQLFSVQLTNLLLSVLDYLRGSGPEVLVAAEEVLSAVLQNHAMKVERVSDVVAGVYTCLQPGHASCWTRKVVLRALTLMIPCRLEEVVQSCLSYSIPLNRQANELWAAMASSPKVAVQILHLLLKNLQVKDPPGGQEDGSGSGSSATTSLALLWGPAVSLARNSANLQQLSEKMQMDVLLLLHKVLAMNVIYETFHLPGYRAALAEMHLQLFIPLLKQVLYVKQLDLPEALKTRQELILRENPTALTFQSTSVEIVKSLFSVAGDWAVYACIEFQQGWVVLSNPQHFLQGTRLLARNLEAGGGQAVGLSLGPSQFPCHNRTSRVTLSPPQVRRTKGNPPPMPGGALEDAHESGVGGQGGRQFSWLPPSGLCLSHHSHHPSDSDFPSRRAMTECNSAQIPGIFGEAALILSSEEDELKKMTALALVIEFLKSSSAIKMMNRFSLREHLEEGLAAPNPSVQDLCLKGLNSFVFQQGKGVKGPTERALCRSLGREDHQLRVSRSTTGRRCPPPFETTANFPLKSVFASLLSAQVKSLRDQLPTMINSIFSGREEDVLDGLSDLMTTLYEMDGQGVGLISVDLALNVRSFFEDERADVRATAISLFGQLVMRSKETERALLKKEVVYSLLPLLLHLKDRETTSCKLTLLHCGVFLGWAHLKLMFRSLAWDDIRSCLVNVWKYLMRNNHDNIHIFISQALGFLHHTQTEIRNGAARFMGYTLNYYSSELSKNLEQEDLSHLSQVFQKMESSSDTSMVHFAKNYRVVLQKLSVKRSSGGGRWGLQLPEGPKAPNECQLKWTRRDRSQIWGEDGSPEEKPEGTAKAQEPSALTGWPELERRTHTQGTAAFQAACWAGRGEQHWIHPLCPPLAGRRNGWVEDVNNLSADAHSITREKSLLECDSRAASPLLLPPDSPGPGRSTLEERGILGLSTPKQVRRTLAQRGKQHSEASERERARSIEAPPGIFVSTSAGTGGKQSPRC
ncbi:maestro heat-like repeat family member 5 [Crotalus adamanteus]|uniref:Maestro heat-like repeat family member 5 n=1 Tax=Crotalus adamanteus TaxID=8729 RepID=A0AAW1B8G1_CROAD